MNGFLSFCNHCKILDHSKLECFQINLNLRKSQSFNPKLNVPIVAKLRETDEVANIPINLNISITEACPNLPLNVIPPISNSSALLNHLTGNENVGNNVNVSNSSPELLSPPTNNVNVGYNIHVSYFIELNIPSMGNENMGNNVVGSNNSFIDASLSLNVSNLVLSISLHILYDSNIDLKVFGARDVGEQCILGQHYDGDSESVFPSSKFVDQWEEGVINSDDERYTLNDLDNFGKVLLTHGSKDDNIWTTVKRKNWNKKKLVSKPSSSEVRIT
ncbi:hypothetical protein KFK09_004039 [Dendrobium nobile]|uniref:Uncharacterized protein n=1 Tax=Dendrobium nobile TaxID=94219 RepID=A0A8T3C4V2_DENNO|nr:hypothetical protein KFK09_004039 [Dendrobium nobile]